MSDQEEAIAGAASADDEMTGMLIEDDGSSGDAPPPDASTSESESEAAASAESADAETAEAAAGQPQPRVEFTPEQQEFMEERIIGPQVARRKAAEERAQALEAELARYREGNPQPETPRDPQSGEPLIPQPPDPFDAKYEEKLNARDQALREHTAWQARQETQQAQQQEQQAIRERQLMQETETYLQRGKDFGLSREELLRAGQFVMEAGGVPENVAEYIVKKEPGPAIMDHLRRNPADLQALQRMTPTEALAHVLEEIKPKAMKSARRRSAPPPPIDPERGTGGASDDMPRGAVFLS